MQPSDFLSLVIEASITIAGFSGIVVVLGRRQVGDWSLTDQIQFRALLTTSITPIAVSGLGLVLLVSEIPSDYVWRICSLINFGLLATGIPTGIRRANKRPKNEINRVHRLVIISSGTAVILLLFANAVAIAAFWPLSVALSFMIGMAIFNFIQLLLRAIFDVPV